MTVHSFGECGSANQSTTLKSLKILLIATAVICSIGISGYIEKEYDKVCAAAKETKQVKRCKESKYDLRMAQRRSASSGEMKKLTQSAAIRCDGLSEEDLK